jgi:hypothetical protein
MDESCEWWNGGREVEEIGSEEDVDLLVNV